jgi:hypothetical protein
MDDEKVGHAQITYHFILQALLASEEYTGIVKANLAREIIFELRLAGLKPNDAIIAQARMCGIAEKI